VERDSTGFDGQTVVTLTTYNSQGLVAETDGPCFANAPCSSSSSERYSYDELGRFIGVAHADGSSRKRMHVGLKTTEFDELQNQHYVVQDQLGHVVKSVAITDAGREISTAFAYEPFGLLKTVTDSNGNVVNTVHDVKGRRLVLRDPDSGGHVYQWTSFDELDDEQDGNGFVTTYMRDALGRVQTITDKDGAANFSWDTAPNGIGKLASATSTDGVTTTYAYDSKGHLSTSTWNIL
jgi:YD repeat-containing protein